MTDRPTTEVAIDATVIEADALILRTHVGEAKADSGDTYTLEANVDGSPMVQLPDGRRVSFSWRALLDAANRAGAADG